MKVNEWLKNFILFLLFGLIYFLIETVWKGHFTHWSMFIVGGLCGMSIGLINEYFPETLKFQYQCLIGAALVTLIEGCSGVILNIILKLNIWNYSNMPLNFFYQQCCIPFCLAWVVLAGGCILIDDYIRWKFLGEEKVKYYF